MTHYNHVPNLIRDSVIIVPLQDPHAQSDSHAIRQETDSILDKYVLRPFSNTFASQDKTKRVYPHHVKMHLEYYSHSFFDLSGHKNHYRFTQLIISSPVLQSLLDLANLNIVISGFTSQSASNMILEMDERMLVEPLTQMVALLLTREHLKQVGSFSLFIALCGNEKEKIIDYYAVLFTKNLLFEHNEFGKLKIHSREDFELIIPHGDWHQDSFGQSMQHLPEFLKIIIQSEFRTLIWLCINCRTLCTPMGAFFIT